MVLRFEQFSYDFSVLFVTSRSKLLRFLSLVSMQVFKTTTYCGF